MDDVKIVAIGGGKGLAQMLRGLRRVRNVVVTGICGNTDSGGKTKRAILEYGAASYLGDLTRCVAALCPDEMFAEALDYRFTSGSASESLEGWTLRHVMLLSLEKTNPEHLDEALDKMCEFCGTGPHRVMPITRGKVSLRGQHAKVGIQDQREMFETHEEAELDAIDEHPMRGSLEYRKLFLSSSANITSRADCAIREADYITIGPGSYLGSDIATLLPDGVVDAFAKSSAKILFFLNICKGDAQTYYYQAEDFVRGVEGVIGKHLHYVICDDSKISTKLARYGRERVPWEDFLEDENYTWGSSRVVLAPLALETDDGQFVHDPAAVARLFNRILAGEIEESAAIAPIEVEVEV